MVSGLLVLYDTNRDSLESQLPDTIHLTENSVVLGRGSLACPVDIQISARKNGKEILSRNHARIDCKKGNYYLVDLQSMNGVFVNNRRIKEKKLSHNDIIQFGGCYSEAIKVGAVLTAADSDICVKYQYKSDDSTNCSNSYSKSKYSNSKNGLRDSNSRNELDISIKKRKAIATESYNSAKKNSRNSSNGGTGNSSANKEIVSKSNEGIDAKVILEELQSLKEMYKKLVDNRESHDGATSSCVAKDIDAVSYEKKDVAIGSADPISATISTEKVVILEKQIEELKAYNQSLQAELNRNSSITVDKDSNCTVQIANIKATHNTNNDANKQHSESEQKSASFSSSNSKSLTCDIDFSAVKSSLQCTLCSSLLIDAVVLSCSHGYCRACLELHLQKRISKCPICNDLLPIGERSSTITVNNSNSVVALQTGSSNSDKCHDFLYMRSDHLDSLVWLLLEAATEDERKTYRSREVEARKILKQLRIDPDTPTVLTYSYVESSGTTGTSSNAVTEMVNENSTSSKNKNLEWINTKLSHRPVSRDGRDSSKCRSTVDDPDQFRISCEFCAGTDHLYTDCPHDLHPEKVLAQSDSDSDSDSTGSMEYE